MTHRRSPRHAPAGSLRKSRSLIRPRVRSGVPRERRGRPTFTTLAGCAGVLGAPDHVLHLVPGAAGQDGGFASSPEWSRAIRRDNVSSAAMTPPVEWGDGILQTLLAGGRADPD